MNSLSLLKLIKWIYFIPFESYKRLCKKQRKINR